MHAKIATMITVFMLTLSSSFTDDSTEILKAFRGLGWRSVVIDPSLHHLCHKIMKTSVENHQVKINCGNSESSSDNQTPFVTSSMSSVIAMKNRSISRFINVPTMLLQYSSSSQDQMSLNFTFGYHTLLIGNKVIEESVLD